MIHKSSNAVEECGRYILERLEETPKATLAISGGGSPKPMWEMFAKQRFDWNRVELFWVDERGVPPDDPQSNFKYANDLWLKPVNFPEGKIHRIHAELEPHAAAERYVREIRKVFGDGIPEFDVIHQGMGPDGHTASLFPGEPLIHDRTGIAAAVWSEPMKQWRITLLPAVLLAAKHTAMLDPGAEKKQMREIVWNGPFDPIRYPTQILREARDVHWFISQE